MIREIGLATAHETTLSYFDAKQTILKVKSHFIPVYNWRISFQLGDGREAKGDNKSATPTTELCKEHGLLICIGNQP